MEAMERPGEERLRYLELLARQYPTVEAAGSEIVNLRAVLDLPKGTEHFISDIHGEYEAFLHILNSASGAVREKIDELFAATLPRGERDRLSTLVYYPREKLEEAAKAMGPEELGEWYRITLNRLIDLARLTTGKYTRSKVRKALPRDHAYILEELLNTDFAVEDKREYYRSILASIIGTGQAPSLIEALCELVKDMVVDRLHIVGDLFDRGPRADIVMDSLMTRREVDIEWGNHDVLWMGAATGSRTLVATVLANSIHYNNLDVIETGYGISLRPLALFANEVYRNTNVDCFAARVDFSDRRVAEKDLLLASRMFKAIVIILLKLEGQKIMRYPGFHMEDRLLLDKIDYARQSIDIDGVTYHLEDTDFPTVDRADPYRLSPEEEVVMAQLTAAFRHSEKLQTHVKFLYSKGGLYRVYNGNLLLHGCIPMNEDGSFATVTIQGREYAGKALLDYTEGVARQGYYAQAGSPERQFGMDFLWFLWAGRGSPLFGRDRMTTFERRLIRDERAWAEPKDPYYSLYNRADICEKILREFGLEGPHCHIINGHVPVKSKKGESPVKGDGRLIVIDGGFCRAYQGTTGIAGYTLIYNSRYYRIVAHQPFAGRQRAIAEDLDITSTGTIFERMESRVKVAETDQGARLRRRVDDLTELLHAYRAGFITEDHRR